MTAFFDDVRDTLLGSGLRVMRPKAYAFRDADHQQWLRLGKPGQPALVDVQGATLNAVLTRMPRPDRTVIVMVRNGRAGYRKGELLRVSCDVVVPTGVPRNAGEVAIYFAVKGITPKPPRARKRKAKRSVRPKAPRPWRMTRIIPPVAPRPEAQTLGAWGQAAPPLHVASIRGYWRAECTRYATALGVLAATLR